MLLAALIAGLSKTEQRERILEYFQSNMALSVSQVIEQIQQMEQVKYFVQDLPLGTGEPHDQTTRIDEIHFQKISNYKFCGSSHIICKCPAYGKKCAYCQKPNHFPSFVSPKEMFRQHICMRWKIVAAITFYLSHGIEHFSLATWRLT